MISPKGKLVNEGLTRSPARGFSLAAAFASCMFFGSIGCSESSSSDDGSGGAGGGAAGAGGGASAGECTTVTAEVLRICVEEYGAAVASCYDTTDAPCAASDAGKSGALGKMTEAVASACTDGAFAGLSTNALVGRLENACASEASSLAWRTYGGPQGAVWPSADASGQSCLAEAHRAAMDLVDSSLSAINACLAETDCDSTTLAAERTALAAAAVSSIDSACGDLSTLVSLDPQTYVDRAAGQVDCLTATGHADTGPVELDCGPSNAQFEAPRGEWKQVVVDGAKWGTMCGDGSDYAFQIRLAPEGERLDRVVIGLQGGGVCLFESDCTARLASSPGLFTAMDDEALGFGIASDDPAESPFANWTKVYLPYCNQDVFAGGGVTESLGAIDVPRYGSVNLRAAVRMVRDVLWKMMDEEGGAGFRPDEIVSLFGGWSAGGYGTIYNYHWMLDDLQWPRTAAFPDAGMALDNGSTLGVAGLGVVKIPAWGTMPNLPPYCFDGGCAVGPVLYEAISPRLLQVPEQQILVLSNPKDDTQRGDAFFDDEAVWINTLRQAYCNTKDLAGLHYYFTSVSDQSIHVVSVRPELWAGEVDGEVMRDWFVRAVTEPDTLVNRVEEGDFVQAISGVQPFPCQVAP